MYYFYGKNNQEHVVCPLLEVVSYPAPLARARMGLGTRLCWRAGRIRRVCTVTPKACDVQSQAVIYISLKLIPGRPHPARTLKSRTFVQYTTAAYVTVTTLKLVCFMIITRCSILA